MPRLLVDRVLDDELMKRALPYDEGLRWRILTAGDDPVLVFVHDLPLFVAAQDADQILLPLFVDNQRLDSIAIQRSVPTRAAAGDSHVVLPHFGRNQMDVR